MWVEDRVGKKKFVCQSRKFRFGETKNVLITTKLKLRQDFGGIVKKKVEPRWVRLFQLWWRMGLEQKVDYVGILVNKSRI